MSEEIQPLGIESRNTSLNHIPTGIKKLVDWRLYSSGGINLDYGGGKYDKAVDYLLKYGVINLVYDPGHYDECHNKQVLKMCSYVSGASSATMLNVLNVIPSKEERLEAIYEMLSHLNKMGKAIVGVYEKNKNGKLEYTGRGWQNNKPLDFYLKEIEESFPHVKIKKKEKFLILSFT